MDLRRIVVGFLALALVPVHAICCWKVDYELYRLAGGVHEGIGMTGYGGTEYAWVNALWALGSVAMGLADRGGAFSWLGGIGLLFILIGSLAAAYSLSSTLIRAVLRIRPVFGRYRWRLWLLIAGWLIWIPVPAEYSVVYGWTVLY